MDVFQCKYIIQEYMRYHTLLFDVDNTLLDFDANEAESFRSLLRDQGEGYTEERYQTYQKLNRELWKSMERQEKTVDEVLNSRFALLMEKYGKQVDGTEWEKNYRKYLNRGIQEIPQVHEVLSELKKDYRLYVVTNGLQETQEYRMKASGLKGYFEKCFISQEIGAAKPSKEFFDYVKEQIPEFAAEMTMIVGDSLTSDILGGNRAGITTCWFRKNGSETLDVPEGEQIPDLVIDHLSDLLTVLNRE